MDALAEFVAAVNGDFDSETATCRFEPAEVRSIEGIAADGETEVVVRVGVVRIGADVLDSIRRRKSGTGASAPPTVDA